MSATTTLITGTLAQVPVYPTTAMGISTALNRPGFPEAPTFEGMEP